jgi:hypothetical protein
VKPSHPYATAVWWVALLAVVPSMYAQEAGAPRHTGFPQDWSEGHIVFSRDTLALHPDLMDREPRVLHQVMQRWQPPNLGVFHDAQPLPTAAGNSGSHRDWSVSPGGRLSPFRYAAKFSFDPGALPDCTNDYVVFGLSSASTPTLPNLVAFNNLYVNAAGTGFCPGTAPNVLFAYEITTVAGGKITTSPILSLDGKKIGFVESIPGASASAIFHVLTWTAGQGTIAAPAVPTAMTSLLFSSSANDSASSPWIDYSADIVYVGADNGSVYKITPVFHGTPLLSGSPWPVVVSINLHLTSPVLDSFLGKVMVGSANGSLYGINTNSGVLTVFPTVGGHSPSPGIVAPPIVDVTNGTTFAVSANDGTSAVLVEFDTALLVELSRGRIGLGAAGGTAFNIHSPAVSNLYFNDPSSGVIRVCGTGPAGLLAATPWQYAFSFTGRTMKSTLPFKQQIPTNPVDSTAARCAGFTEFFNPNVGILGTDYFFFGLTKDCTAAGGGGGCVAEFTDAAPSTILTRTVSGGPSGIIVDNYSPVPQVPSIYFTAEGINTAYRFTQEGLN